MRDVWVLPLVQGKERLRQAITGHCITQKPEEMLRRIILASSQKGMWFWTHSWEVAQRQ